MFFFRPIRNTVNVEVHVPESEACKQARDLVSMQRRIRDLEDQLAMRRSILFDSLTSMIESATYDSRRQCWVMELPLLDTLLAQSPELQEFVAILKTKRSRYT